MAGVSRARTCHHGCLPGARERGGYLRPIPGSRKRMNWNAQLLGCWKNAALKIVALGSWHCQPKLVATIDLQVGRYSSKSCRKTD